eukprot:1157742-Pelagomonas_calceolata.AAC.5
MTSSTCDGSNEEQEWMWRTQKWKWCRQPPRRAPRLGDEMAQAQTPGRTKIKIAKGVPDLANKQQKWYFLWKFMQRWSRIPAFASNPEISLAPHLQGSKIVI